jgi:hypothetical protein
VNLEIWRFGEDFEIWRFWRFGDFEIWRLGELVISRFAKFGNF